MGTRKNITAETRVGMKRVKTSLKNSEEEGKLVMRAKDDSMKQAGWQQRPSQTLTQATFQKDRVGTESGTADRSVR